MNGASLRSIVLFLANWLPLTSLSNQFLKVTALMINGSNVVGTRELGSIFIFKHFNSTGRVDNSTDVTL